MDENNSAEISVQKRGVVTGRIRTRSRELLGYEVETTELRLMPYVISVMMDYQKIDPRKVNEQERRVLQKWREAGYIEGGASGLSVTRDFWGIITELVYLGYVELGVPA